MHRYFVDGSETDRIVLGQGKIFFIKENSRRSTDVKKNYAVQVYRILCTLIICWHHFQGAVGKIEILKHGYICVEFFFILSGYFLVRYFAEEETNGGHSTVGYLLHRIKRLYPEYCFAAVVAILIIGIGGRKFTPVKAIAEMLMIQYLGIIGGGYNTPCWYISVLLCTSVLIYGMLVQNKNLYIRVIAPAMIVTGYAFIAGQSDVIEVWDTEGFIYVPLLRGFCAMSIGVLVERLTHNKNLLLKNRRTATTAELICLIVICIGIAAEETWDYLVIAAFAVLIFLAMTGQGGIGCFLNRERKSVNYLGDLAYTLYLNHSVISKGIGFINHFFNDITMGIYIIEVPAFWGLLFTYSMITKRIVNGIVRKINGSGEME